MPPRAIHTARALGRNLRTNWGVEGPWQWGTVQAVSLGVGSALTTVSVYLDNASGGAGATITSGIPVLDSYIPTVGDVVLIGRMAGAARTQRVVISSLATGTARPPVVGTVAFGPPLSGTFQKGDLVEDLTTYGMWVCTVAGSPGTWAPIGGSVTSPKAPSVTVNTTGTTSWWYKIYTEGKNGSTFYHSIPGSPTKITNGAAAPNNTLNWPAPLGVDATLVSYGVLRSSDGVTYTRIGFTAVGVTTLTDNNASGVADTAATFNPGGGFVLGGQYARCAVKQSTAIADTNGVVTLLPLDTIIYDFTPQLSGGGYYSTANKQLTIPFSGIYHVDARVTIPNNSAGDRGLDIFVNGSLLTALQQQTSTVASGNPLLSGSITPYFNAGDVVDIRVSAPGTTAGAIAGGQAEYTYIGS